MDISFHYYAVKTLAYIAGFKDKEAQIIAQYSQYVDDYNPTYSRRYGNVPDWLRNKAGSDIYIPDKLNPFNFRPVTTGFAIPVDIASMLTKTFQRNVISPFHFIPFNREKMDKGEKVTMPAKITNGGDDSLIAKLLNDAKQEYRQDSNEEQRRYKLMHIGMLLHVFADTYAHQTFSGYNEICNNMKVSKIIDNNTGIDITSRTIGYVDKILKLYEDAEGKFNDKLFEIGHMLVGHVPDWTHISFEMKFFDANGNTQRIYKRNNTLEFTNVAMEILDFLCECNGQHKFTGNGRQDIYDKLYRDFQIADISSVEGDMQLCMSVLTNAWGAVFENSHYSYNPSLIFDGIVKLGKPEKIEGAARDEDGIFPDMSEDFYKFNSYAEDLLIALYGDNPRRLTRRNDMENINIKEEAVEKALRTAFENAKKRQSALSAVHNDQWLGEGNFDSKDHDVFINFDYNKNPDEVPAEKESKIRFIMQVVQQQATSSLANASKDLTHDSETWISFFTKYPLLFNFRVVIVRRITRTISLCQAQLQKQRSL